MNDRIIISLTEGKICQKIVNESKREFYNVFCLFCFLFVYIVFYIIFLLTFFNAIAAENVSTKQKIEWNLRMAHNNKTPVASQPILGF